MIIETADRTRSVNEYYFSVKNKEISRRDADRKAMGLDPIIKLGQGSPDGMPPLSAIEKLRESSLLPDVHAYQSYVGIPELRQAFADWYARFYGVMLNSADEIQPLVGSKEGILLTSLTFVNKGDKVLIPDPGYPTYASASKMVEAEILTYDLKADNNWWPDFDRLEQMDLDGVKIMWTNYPNMPTGAPASKELYQELVDFAQRHKILVVNDNPYSFIQNEHPISILSIKGARDYCIELNSLSKAHNMSGWRIGMIGGAAEYVQEVLKVKSQMDSGMFRPLQLAAVEALRQGPEWFAELNAEYARRKKSACEIFDTIGVEYDTNTQGLFLWGRIPDDNILLNKAQREGFNPSWSKGELVSEYILDKAGVFITPGFIFGKNGRDYIRISLCAKVEMMQRACSKIKVIMA